MEREERAGRSGRHTRFWQNLYMVAGVLCVAVLFVAAMLFPNYYSRLYDQNTLNQTAFTDMNIRTYETTYDSFVAKLHMLAKSFSKSAKDMSAVRTNSLELTMDKDELTGIVRKELEKLYEYKVITLKLKPKTKRLVKCERYTIYVAKGSDAMKGISCWKLIYETSKRRITVYLDEEYHKIYYLDIYYKYSVDKTDPVSAGKLGTKGEGTDWGSVYDSESGVYGTLNWGGLEKYYGFTAYKDGECETWQEDGLTGLILFDGQYELRMMKNYYDNDTEEDAGNGFWVGLPLEKMIQF